MIYIKSVYFNKKKEYNDSKYEFNIPAIKQLIEQKELKFSTDVTFFVGENGVGKSTLLESLAIASGFNPEGGTRNFNFSTKDTHSQLSDYLVLSKSHVKARDGFFYRAESFYNVSTNIDELDSDVQLLDSYGGISLHKQSHGEGFLSLIKNRFGGNGLYILDEPEAALSPSRQMSLICLIDQLVERNSQFIIATHSPILMAFPNATIYQIDDKGFKTVKLEETEHYIITKAFTNNYKKMISELLE
ncbi:AAA family ATPase [Lacrimispora sphenoides]|uniref:Predicted ATPase n=1 Tax=Lacrimispora sphenoides JCM 1415 TaxID=1297793 RepID=A0ABY1CCD8_9FIRM|nr:AAA family ATPase [Lacrimispora sphenoides]SET90383.1 Predicted ATPase [[Clostridium] sphenoides JCM 1415]SUY52212.1 ATP-binding protein [Lacrimispora sphenoides]